MLVFYIAAPENAHLADETCRAAGILLYKEVGRRVGLAQTVRTRNLSGYAMLLVDLAALEDDEAELHSAVYSLRLMYPQIRIIALELRDGREEPLERLREAGVGNIAQRPEDLPIALSHEGMKGVVIRKEPMPEPVLEAEPVFAQEPEPTIPEESVPHPDIIIPPALELPKTKIPMAEHPTPEAETSMQPLPHESQESAEIPPAEPNRHKRPFVLREKKRKGAVLAGKPPEQSEPQARMDESLSAPAPPPDRESLAGIRLPRLGLRRPPKRAKPVTVGVCGIMRRIGTTTHALGLAAYLVAQGEAVCCVEANEHGHFERFEQYQNVVRTEDGTEVFKGIPIAFPDAPVSESARFLVYDFGLLDDHREAFEQCDIRVLCIGSKPWELSWLGRLFQSRTDLLMHAHFIVGFTGEEERGKMLSVMGRLAKRTHFAAYAPSFADGRANAPIYESILAK